MSGELTGCWWELPVGNDESQEELGKIKDN